jgi:hypothetical protein
VQVASGKTVQSIAVPRDALVLRRDGLSVFRINENNQAEKISGEVDLASGNLVSLKNTSTDLLVGDSIVIRGAERLQPGQLVTIKDNNHQLISGSDEAITKNKLEAKSITKPESKEEE